MARVAEGTLITLNPSNKQNNQPPHLRTQGEAPHPEASRARHPPGRGLCGTAQLRWAEQELSGSLAYMCHPRSLAATVWAEGLVGASAAAPAVPAVPVVWRMYIPPLAARQLKQQQRYGRGRRTESSPTSQHASSSPLFFSYSTAQHAGRPAGAVGAVSAAQSNNCTCGTVPLATPACGQLCKLPSIHSVVGTAAAQQLRACRHRGRGGPRR